MLEKGLANFDEKMLDQNYVLEENHLACWWSRICSQVNMTKKAEHATDNFCPVAMLSTSSVRSMTSLRRKGENCIRCPLNVSWWALSVFDLHLKFQKRMLVSEAEREVGGRRASCEKYPGCSSDAGSLGRPTRDSRRFQSSPTTLRSHITILALLPLGPSSCKNMKVPLE